MIDLANITVTAGSGGRGAGSFMHVKGKRRGKADGGDGGRGGNVYLVATGDLNTLEPYRFNKDFKAENGVAGLSKLKNGANGRDLELKVPVGTQVKVTEVTEEPEEPKVNSKKPPARLAPLEHLPLYDLIEDGQKVLVARGGEGGRGNAHLRDEYGRRPLAGEVGGEGEVLSMRLELKLIAQVGLIGLPNAGKSTLLTALTAARPQIAPYPFTTLEPNLGTLSVPGGQVTRLPGYQEVTREPDNLTSRKPRQIVLADIPGLIEGASAGKGLGHEFLRHIERTKILVHLIDATGEDKWKSYQKIRTELKAHSAELAKKKEIIVVNKADLVNEGQKEEVKAEFASHRKRVLFISAKEGLGIDELVKEITKLTG